ncbi:MAG TPA: heavy-metal-associated domain-containing protein [Ornithinibacter sp.]|nr:heavy-metal-associated domain-containing protein [Ornithinibacter sp.]
MNSQTYPVAGLTCEHCVQAISSEIRGIPGVTDVAVNLVAGGTSQLTIDSATPLSETAIVAALDEAGDYHLTSR